MSSKLNLFHGYHSSRLKTNTLLAQTRACSMMLPTYAVRMVIRNQNASLMSGISTCLVYQAGPCCIVPVLIVSAIPCSYPGLSCPRRTGCSSRGSLNPPSSSPPSPARASCTPSDCPCRDYSPRRWLVMRYSDHSANYNPQNTLANQTPCTHPFTPLPQSCVSTHL